MNDAGTLAVFTLAILLLVVLTMRMDKETIALVAACMLFFLVCRRNARNDSGAYSMFDPASDAFEASPVDENVDKSSGPAVDNSPIFSGKGANTFAIAMLDKSQRPPEPVYPQPSDTDRARISKSNGIAIGELYGRRSGGTMDNAIYQHAQRIGDRDRQATINQIRGRRANTYEPYFRQELSAHENKRWWSNEDVIVTKLDKRQMDTIDMGRFRNDDSDLDGIYGQY